MGKLLRGVLVVAVLVVPSFAAQATCQYWQCRRFVNTADCLIRMGPNSQSFPFAASCEGDCNCMPDTMGTGTLNCDCFCRFNYCYSV
jgi:hypothetical protein